MEKNQGRIYYSPNVVNLCIDTYGAEKQCGRLWSQYAGEPQAFTSLYEALEYMEALYDALRYPYAATKMRSFQEDEGNEVNVYGFAGRAESVKHVIGGTAAVSGSAGRDSGKRDTPFPGKYTAGEGGKGISITEAFDDVIAHRGQDATFIIRVQYRQHSSWQGEVVWVDGGKRRYFESVLELVRLIDRALEGTDGTAPVSGD